MKTHEAKVKELVTNIEQMVNQENQWKITIMDNNKLLGIVEELRSEICMVYVENIRR